MNCCGQQFEDRGKRYICVWATGHTGPHNGPEVNWDNCAQWLDKNETTMTEPITNPAYCGMLEPRSKTPCKLARGHSTPHDWEKAQDQATEVAPALICGQFYGQWYPIEEVERLPVRTSFILGWAGMDEFFCSAYRIGDKGWNYSHDDIRPKSAPTHFMLIKGPKAQDTFDAFCAARPSISERLRGSHVNVGGLDRPKNMVREIWDAAKEAK